MTKISELSAGTPAVLTDKVPVARGSSNYYLTVDDILDRGSVIVLGVQNTGQTKTDADTNETALYTLQIPGGLMGANDSLEVYCRWTVTSGATNKSARIKLGSTSFGATGMTTIVSHMQYCLISNRNATNSQIGNLNNTTQIGTSSASLITGSIDTTQNQDLTVTAQWASAGAGSNNITLETVLVRLIRA